MTQRIESYCSAIEDNTCKDCTMRLLSNEVVQEVTDSEHPFYVGEGVANMRADVVPDRIPEHQQDILGLRENIDLIDGPERDIAEAKLANPAGDFSRSMRRDVLDAMHVYRPEILPTSEPEAGNLYGDFLLAVSGCIERQYTGACTPDMPSSDY